MANSELIDDIVAKRAETQVANLTESLKVISKQISDLNKSAGQIRFQASDGGNLIGINKQLKELAENTKKVEALTKQQAQTAAALAKAEEQLERVRTQAEKTNGQKLKNTKDEANAETALIKTKREKLKAEQDELRLRAQIAAADEKLNKERLKEEKQVKDLTNDYAILSKAYNDAALRAKNYALQLGANHRITLMAINDANQLGDKLKLLDAVVGQHNRTVGNYNLVGTQFNQILRELPNLAQSPAIFIQALSNNLSYFVESVVAAKKEGQGLGAIFSGLFKGGNALVLVINLAVTAFSSLANVLRSNSAEAKQAEESYKNLGTAISNAITQQNKLRSTRGESLGGGLAAAERELQLLQAQGAAPGAIIAAQEKVSKARVQQLDNERSAVQALNAEIRRSADYYASQGLDSKAVREKLAADQDIIKSLRDVTGVTETEAKKQVEAIARNYNTSTSIIPEFLARIRELDVEILNEEGKFEAERAKAFKDADDKRKKELEKQIKAQQEIEKRNREARYETLKQELEFEADTQKDIATDERNGLKIRYDAFSKYYETKLKIINLVAEYEASIDGKTADEIKQIRSKLGLELEALAQEAVAYDQKIFEDGQKERDKFDAAQRKSQLANEKTNNDTIDRLKAAWKKFYQYVRDQAAQTIGAIANAFAQANTTRANNEIEALQRQIDASERAKNVEIERIKVSQLAAEDKEKAIQEAEARTEAKRAALEAQQRQRRRQAALGERSAAIAQLVIDTAQAVIRALGDKTVPYPVRVGYAIAAGAVGASQIAIARSAPLPEYKEGTGDHAGGWAKVGDGGEKELVITPSGQAFMTPDKPTVMDLPKHTQVLNQQMISNMAGVLAQKKDRAIEKAIEASGNETAKKIVQAIARNRTNVTTVIKSKDTYIDRKTSRNR